MILILKIKLFSEENGGRRNPVENGYRPAIKTSTSNYFDCVFNLPFNKTLELDRTYENLQVEVKDHFPAALGAKVYFYEGHRMIGEAIVTKINK